MIPSGKPPPFDIPEEEWEQIKLGLEEFFIKTSKIVCFACFLFILAVRPMCHKEPDEVNVLFPGCSKKESPSHYRNEP